MENVSTRQNVKAKRFVSSALFYSSGTTSSPHKSTGEVRKDHPCDLERLFKQTCFRIPKSTKKKSTAPVSFPASER